MNAVTHEAGYASECEREVSPTALAGPSRVALTRLLRALQHAVLYPTDHPEFESALALALGHCETLLDLCPVCSVRQSSGHLHVEGATLPSDSTSIRFAERLRERGIPAVTFRAGLTKDELHALLRVLRAEPEMVLEQGGAAAWLRLDGVRHVSLGPPSPPPSPPADWESFLLAQEPSDRDALRKLIDLCSDSGYRAETSDDRQPALAGLAQVFGQTARDLPEHSPLRASWLRRIAVALGELSPELRAKLFRVRIAPELDVLGEVACLLSVDAVVDILVTYPGAVVGEESDQLAVLMKRLLPTEERARMVEPRARAALLSRGMTEESYQSTVLPILRRTVPSSGRVPDSHPVGGPQRISLFTDLISQASESAMRDHRIDMLLELVASDQTNERRHLIPILVEVIPDSLAECSDDRAVEMLRRLDETIAEAHLCPADKRSLRACLTAACSPDLSRRLACFLSRSPSRRDAFLLPLLSRTASGFEALVSIAKETSSDWVRAAAGAAVTRMGERSLDACRQSLTAGPPEEAAALVRALVLSGVSEGLDRALWALEHPDPQVVSALMVALSHGPRRRALPLLIWGLEDGLPEVQIAAAQSLASHPFAEAVAALGEVLAGRRAYQSPELSRAAIASLGRMNSSEAAGILRGLLNRRQLISRRRLGELQKLCVEALAGMTNPAAAEALMAKAQDGQTEVARLCRQALDSGPSACAPGGA